MELIADEQPYAKLASLADVFRCLSELNAKVQGKEEKSPHLN